MGVRLWGRASGAASLVTLLPASATTSTEARVDGDAGRTEGRKLSPIVQMTSPIGPVAHLRFYDKLARGAFADRMSADVCIYTLYRFLWP